MTSKPCDDPMDLGPFLQNYVLRNPFHEFMLGSGQPSEGLSKPKEGRATRKVLLASSIDGGQPGTDATSGPSVQGRLKRNNKQDDDGSCDGSSSGQVRPRKLFVTSVEGSCLDLAGSGPPEVVERSIKQEVDVVDGGCASIDGLTFMNSTTGMQNILSDYPEVHQWLCSNFKYLSRYHNCLTSAKILLHKVQRTFPHLTKVVLGQLVSVAFPCCPMIVQEGETFYQGLVPKLAEGILENAKPNFMTALENVTKGLMSLQEAAEKFDVPEMALKSVLMWDKVDLAVNGLTSTEASLSSSSLSQANGFTHKKRRSSREFGKESRIRTVSTRTTVRHRAIKRARLLSVTANASTPTDSNDDSIDFETMLQNIQGESSASVLQRTIIQTPSKDLVDQKLSLLNDIQPLSVKEELPDEMSETRAEPKTRSVNSNRSRPSILSASIDMQDHRAIGDAVTLSTGCSNGSTASSSPIADRHSSPASVKSVRFLEQRRKKPAVLGSDGGLVSDLERRFQRMQQELANCHGANLKLRNELESVQSENLLLKEELNTRDFHLVHLAEDFFKLHSQFKLLAEQFQVILNETQNSLSQSLIGHNSR